jgi:hypothetical protein
LDFLAEVTQHIPDKGEHLVRYYGWYSHRQRGIRKRTRQVGQVESDKLTIHRSALDTQTSATGGALSAWAMLIKRVYEVDPLECPCCGGQMKIVSFIELGPKIVKLVVVRSDDVGFPSIQLQKGRQRCSKKWMPKPVCVTLGPLPTIQIAISQ